MHRPRPSFWIATATVAALALGGGVAAASRDGGASTDAPARHSRTEDRRGFDDGVSTSTSTTPVTAPSTSSPTTPVVVPSTVPSGSDDPATHDVGDDHGADDPATHDVGDDHGADDPATHDVGDDHGADGDRSVSNRGPDSGSDDSGDGGHGPG